LEAAERAAAWCDLLEAHMRRIYQMASDGNPQAARNLAERLLHASRNGIPNPFTARDIYRKSWSQLTTPFEVERALEILEEYGWVKAVEQSAGKNGGRPTVVYYINPALQPGLKGA
jgi:hypothetical protein